MGPYYGPLPPVKGSQVWGLGLYGVCKGGLESRLLPGTMYTQVNACSS